MAPDPAPFLATIAGCSAGLVAIVGGLLVARFVTLDSEQLGAQRVLDDAEARLSNAITRAASARERLLRWDARQFLYDRSVVGAILDGVTNLTDLRRHDEHNELADVQLEPFVNEVRTEVDRARQILEALVSNSRYAEQGRWDDFRRTTPNLPETQWDIAWEVVFDRIAARCEAEKKAAEEAEAAKRSPFERMLRVPGLHIPYFPPVSRTDVEAIGARRRDDLATSHERAQQQVEDINGEVQRLKQARDAVVNPRGLGLGLSVLAYFTLVGVVAPVYLLLRIQDPLNVPLNAVMANLQFGGFCSGLALLLGYMAVLALRLSRRPRRP